MNHLTGARVVLVEDDPTSAEYITYVLSTLGGCTVDHFPDPLAALDDLAARRCDAVITDIQLPGIGGLEFLRQARELRPGVPVVVITAFATVDVAIEAVQSRAAGFLEKPIVADDLLERVDGLIAESREWGPRRRVLAIGAHPDDIEIGAGATLLRHRAGGDEIAVAIMTSGVQGGDGATRLGEAQAAADALGARLFVGDLEDTRIPEGHPSVTFLEQCIAEFAPDVVYTHTVHDVHQDHRNTHRATLVAARSVPAVYCYQSPSATVEFSPTRFVDVDGSLAGKLDLIELHSSQATQRAYLDPALIGATARYWGRYGETALAEPFEVVRERTVALQEVSHVAA